MYSLEEYSRLSINDQAQIEAICASFEEEWQQGHQPSLEQAISGWTGAERSVLLQELLQIELHYRTDVLGRVKSEEHDEFEKRGLGQHPIGIEQICELYPSIADEIRLAWQANEREHVTIVPSQSDAAGDIESTAGKERRIGDYFLVEQIGQGGMGSVWLAEQREPIRRQIALKLIKSGLESEDINARFHAERQSLAIMNHPNIAKVLEVGTDGDRPFMAMELVDGSPIIDYCRQKQLDVRNRLRLFIDVCRAVGHAHKKGVIHRDIKPSNVLVTESDGQAMPKVIDFGLAKALDRKLDDVSWSTQMHSFVGTLPYMSPEQTDPELQNIDIRSDIYSLGVLLYELLTGSRPLQISQTSIKTLQETIEAIRSEAPALPSHRVKELGDSEDSICRQLSTQPHRLSQQLSGDLDWITCKAMQKDQMLRYQNTDELADDVERYLNDEPVVAHPPSATYRAGKFYRRHRFAVIAAATVLFLLVAGVVGTSLGMVWAIQSENAARQMATKERAAKELANQRLEHAQNSRQILASIFTGIDPFGVEKSERPLREELAMRLDDAEAKLTSAPIGGPVDIADMRALLGKAQYGLGNFDKAISILGQAVPVFESELGSVHEQTLIARILIGLSERDSGNMSAATETLEGILDTLDQTEHSDKASPAIKATVQMALAALHQQAGEDEQAALYERLAEETTGNELVTDLEPIGRLQVQLQNRKGIRLKQLGEYAEAKRCFERSVKLSQQHFGARHPNTLNVRTNLAIVYQAMGQTFKGIELLEDILEIQTQRMGRNHVSTLRTRNTLATALAEQKNFQRAENILNEIKPVLKESVGELHSDYLLAVSNLATVYRQTSRYEQAIATYESVIEPMRNRLGEGHRETLNTTLGLGVAYQKKGEIEKSLTVLKAWWDSAKKHVPTVDGSRYSGLYSLSSTYRLLEDYQAAVDLLSGEIESARTKLGPLNPVTINLENALGESLYRVEQYEQSIPHYTAVLNYCLEKHGDQHNQTINALYNLGAAKLAAGQVEDGLQLLERSHESYIKNPGITPAYELESRLMVANLLKDAGQYQRAESMLRTAIKNHQSELTSIPIVDARLNSWLGWTIAQSVLDGKDGDSQVDENVEVEFSEEEQSKLDEAETLLLASYQKLIRVVEDPDKNSDKINQAKAEILNIAKALTKLYQKTNRPEQVKQWTEITKKYSD